MYDKSADRSERLKALISYLTNKNKSSILKVLNSGDNSSDDLEKAIFAALDSGKDISEKLELILTKVDLSKIEKDKFENFLRLVTLIDDRTIEVNTSSTYLYNPTLYNRSVFDFEYAVRVLDTIHDPRKYKKLFGDNKIDPKVLYDGQVLKPSGAVTRDLTDKTIHGIVYRTNNASSYTSKSHSEQTKSRLNTYKSLKDIEETDKWEGNIVHIEGDYTFRRGKWELIEK